MKILSKIVEAFRGSRSHSDEATEYVPYETYDWRGPLLLEAARKHGKPFKCAADELPREIILRGKELAVIGADEWAMHGSAQSPEVQGKPASSVLGRLSDTSVLGLHRRQRELSRAMHE